MNSSPSSNDAAAAIQTAGGTWRARSGSGAMSARSYRAMLAVLVTAVAAIYCARLSEAPIYLSHDEVFFALNAHQIGYTGRDLGGNLLPIYVHVLGNYWLTAA